MASQNRTHASDRGKAVVDIPGIPTIGTATAGGESATVEFTANVRGGAATTFTALSNPGSITGTGSSSPVTVEGLTVDTAYTFTVRGSNATGNGEYSAASNSVTPFVSTAFESIQTVTVGSGGQSSITFSSIPSTYKHLQMRGILQSNYSPFGVDDAYLTFNGDSSAVYSWHEVQGNGSSAYAAAGSSATSINWGLGSAVGTITGNQSDGGTYAASITDILDYSNQNKFKTLRTISGNDFNGTGYNDQAPGRITLNSGLWQNSAAINSITVLCGGGRSFTQYSQLALYGIRG